MDIIINGRRPVIINGIVINEDINCSGSIKIPWHTEMRKDSNS